jgi:murein DD-endopeptidase MepM/ murein hydrolase activator NlpD
MDQAQIRIVAQKVFKLAPRLRRLALAAVLPFVGVVAAFGIAPDTVPERLVVSRVVENVPLPLAASNASAEDTYWHEERIQRGDTIGALLSRLTIEDPEAVQYLRTTRETRALYQLVPGRMVRAHTTAEGKLISLRYMNGGNVSLVQRDGNTYRVSEQAAPLERRTLMKSSEIRSSLFAATDSIGLSDAVATQLADIFSTDIDFHKDLRRGDRFTVIYEVLYDNGEPVRTGRVLAAEFVNQGKSYQAMWFETEEGKGGYYTLEGRNIRKAFLRSPLEFSRISSGFTQSRYHPVLNQWRAHRGIDYAAAQGTGVKATADGVVDFVGRQGGYGNIVVLRHQTQYTTWYGHLSRFAKSMHKGMRVSQGEVIGYVGATGLATGPHLHYEFRINGVHQDPLRVVMPSAPPITADLKVAFEAKARPMLQRLTLLRGANFARLD